MKGRRTSRGRQGPTKRLLIAPALIFVALIVGLTLIEDASPRNPDPALVVEVPRPDADDEQRRCVRDGDPQAVGDIRATLGRQPVVTSAMVLGCPTAFDGLDVAYAGELVGDLLYREGGAWVLVNDDAYALEVGPLPAHGAHRGTNSGLTVWVPDALIPEIDGLGRPGQRGDVAVVTGRIVRTDATDGGGLTLRADTLRVVAATAAIDEPIDRPQAWFALGASVVALLLWAARRRATR